MEEYRDSVKTGYLTEKFRLFHLKDREPKEYEYHYHDFYKLIWFISGNVEYHIEGKAYKLEPHDILLVNIGQIHKPFIGTDEPYERYVFYISKDFLSEHSEEESNLALCFQMAETEDSSVVRLSPSDSGLLFETVKLLEQSEKKSAFAGEMYSRILFLKLLIELNRCCMKNSGVFHKTARYDKKIVEMIHYINDHLEGDLSIEGLSACFYLSKYHMMRKFKNETGYTIHNYITSKRLLLARSLINEGTPVMKAAQMSGFNDYTTFVRSYKKQFGNAPSHV